MGKSYNFTVVLLVILVVTAIRLAYLYLATKAPYSQLFFDEAQYWTWSKVLDFGYYSKPPIIAWLISFTTAFCGDTAFCIKLSAPVLHGLTSALIFLTASKLFDRKTGFWAAVLYLTLPGVTMSSAFISTDAPLMFFWTLALYAFVRALEGFDSLWWIATGAAIGLGLMSKYTMVIFVISMGLYMLTTRVHRQYLFSLSFVLCLGLAGALFAPNILWNMSNDFVSFSHTEDNVLSLSLSLYPKEAGEFIAGQLAVFGPLLFAALLWICAYMGRIFRDDELRMMFLFTMPLLVIAVGVALTASAQAHWAAPAYISGSILVVNWLLERGRGLFITVSLVLHVIMALGFYNYHFIEPHLKQANIIRQELDPFARVRRWNALAQPVSEALHRLPSAFVMADERKAVAPLMYNLRLADGKPYPVLKWNPEKQVRDYYDMTTDMNKYRGKDFVFVTRRGGVDDMKSYFESTYDIKLDNLPKGFRMFYMRGFRGY